MYGWLIQDTVIDAGKYDGALGILVAIAAVKALQKSGRLGDFPRPIEVKCVGATGSMSCDFVKQLGFRHHIRSSRATGFR